MVELKVEFLDLVRASLSLGMVGTFRLSDCDDLVEPGSTIALILLERQLEPSIIKHHRDPVQPTAVRTRRLQTHTISGITFRGMELDSVWRDGGIDTRDAVLQSWIYKGTVLADTNCAPQRTLAPLGGSSDLALPKHGVSSSPPTAKTPIEDRDEVCIEVRTAIYDAHEDVTSEPPHSGPLDRQSSVNKRINVKVLSLEELKGEGLDQAIKATKVCLPNAELCLSCTVYVACLLHVSNCIGAA